MGPFDWRGLVWLEDYDGEFHLRIKRKLKHDYPNLVGWAKRVGMGVHPVYLRALGGVWDSPDGKEGYVHYWHPYVRGKDPVEYRKEREAAKQAALAAQGYYSMNLAYVPTNSSSPSSQVAYKFTYPAPPQLFHYVNPAPQKKLDCDTSVVAPIVGWRRWSVDMFGSVLKSNNGTKWEPYTRLAAECKACPSIADPAGLNPGCRGVHCSCGIYAYKERQQAEAGENAPTSEIHIWGECYLWGRVIEHETGFRAQFGYPKSFVNTGGIAEQLSVIYGVPLIPQEAPCTTK